MPLPEFKQRLWPETSTTVSSKAFNGLSSRAGHLTKEGKGTISIIKLAVHMLILVQVNLDMTDHCMTDFCI